LNPMCTHYRPKRSALWLDIREELLAEGIKGGKYNTRILL
jgi:hypothetical protein